jgi:hypothetical protein
MDKYYEQLTKAYKSALYEVYTVLMVLMGIILIFTLTSMLYPAAIAAAALAVLFFFLKQKTYIEYEYIFTNGDVDIDRIIAAKRRKKVTRFDIRDVQIMAPLGSPFLDGSPKGKKVIAYTRNTKEKIYLAVVNKNNAVTEIYFTPDEQFVGLCFRANPKNVKK